MVCRATSRGFLMARAKGGKKEQGELQDAITAEASGGMGKSGSVVGHSDLHLEMDMPGLERPTCTPLSLFKDWL